MWSDSKGKGDGGNIEEGIEKCGDTANPSLIPHIYLSIRLS
jgi:hypothetical protein